VLSSFSDSFGSEGVGAWEHKGWGGAGNQGTEPRKTLKFHIWEGSPPQGLSLGTAGQGGFLDLQSLFVAAPFFLFIQEIIIKKVSE